MGFFSFGRHKNRGLLEKNLQGTHLPSRYQDIQIKKMPYLLLFRAIKQNRTRPPNRTRLPPYLSIQCWKLNVGSSPSFTSHPSSPLVSLCLGGKFPLPPLPQPRIHPLLSPHPMTHKASPISFRMRKTVSASDPATVPTHPGTPVNKVPPVNAINVAAQINSGRRRILKTLQKNKKKKCPTAKPTVSTYHPTRIPATLKMSQIAPPQESSASIPKSGTPGKSDVLACQPLSPFISQPVMHFFPLENFSNANIVLLSQRSSSISSPIQCWDVGTTQGEAEGRGRQLNAGARLRLFSHSAPNPPMLPLLFFTFAGANHFWHPAPTSQSSRPRSPSLTP